MPVLPLSVVDFSDVRRGERPGDGIARSVAIAQKAESLGYTRVWYSEHHNFAGIASSAPAIVIAHIAANTQRIRLGAGGVMLPNHSPYVVAEQFGTLEEMYPGRIDLGLGRAPGTDPNTMQALRRRPGAAEQFPQDVQELMGWLGDESPMRGVSAIPGRGTKVPLYILGSSLFGAELAAALGLPYSFASHFAPPALKDAVHAYRSSFRPSAFLDEPYVIAAVNATAADTTEEAERMAREAIGRQAASMAFKTREVTDEQIESILATQFGQQSAQMLGYYGIGTGEEVATYLQDFADEAGADELMVMTRASDTEASLHSLELLAQAWGLDASANPSGAAGDPTGWKRN